MENMPAGTGLGDKTWPTRDMHLIVTLIAKGYKPVESGIYAKDGILYYEFRLSDIAETLNKYTYREPIIISHLDFWDAMGQFKHAMSVYLPR